MNKSNLLHIKLLCSCIVTTLLRLPTPNEDFLLPADALVLGIAGTFEIGLSFIDSVKSSRRNFFNFSNAFYLLSYSLNFSLNETLLYNRAINPF